MVNYNNLEVFILTYNRAELFAQTLETICRQSVFGFDIIVVDNASVDNTGQVVDEFKQKYLQRNIVFASCEKNTGNEENFNRARQMAKKEWAMIFHDDDLVHPDYIKTAMDLLEKTPAAVTASCTYMPCESPADGNWEKFSSKAYIGDGKEFASLLFRGVTQNFASTIYKTEFLKLAEIKNNIFGKMWDRPFMMDVAKNGRNILLKDPYIRYRIHSGQDTNNSLTGPFEHEYVALMDNYKSILGGSWFNRYGFIYNSFIHLQLRMGFYWIHNTRSKKGFGEFKNLAAEKNVIRKFEKYRLVEKLYQIPRFLCKFAFNIYDKIVVGR